MRRRFLISCLLALIMVGCGTVSPTTAPTGPPRATQPAPTAASPGTAASTTVGDRLFVRDDYGSATSRLSVVDAQSGTRIQNLPFGAPLPDWSVLYTTQYTTQQNLKQTTVRAVDPLTGQTLRETTIGGLYALPSAGIEDIPHGLSPNGKWLVLGDQPSYAADATNTSQQSRLVVFDTAFTQPPKPISLDGNFTFDAISNNGASLYLIETLPPTGTATPGLGYKVRLYDLTTGVLQPGVVVDKTAIAETMSGTHQSSMISPDGQWVYSLYLNQAKGPFIHMLNLNDRYAMCVFLPTTGKEDYEKQLLWSLAQTRDGKTLYAVNGALGVVAVVDPAGFNVRRTVTLPTPAADRPGVVARIGDWLMPTVGAKRILSGGAALTPDGQTLFVIAENGLLAVDTRDLTLRGRYLTAMPLDSVAVSSDGARLYAVSAEQGKLLLLDSATGVIVREIAGARHPWGVLGVM